MPQGAKRPGTWRRRLAGGVLAGLVALAAASAVVFGDPTPDQNSRPVTDTTAPAPDAAQGSIEDAIRVTDTTLARTPPPRPAGAQPNNTQPTTTTTAASATTATTTDWSVPPLTRHPAWDNRLPGTWDGLKGTECHNTFEIRIWSRSFRWHDAYDSYGGLDYGYDENEVIGRALKDPSYEPLRGTKLHTALTNLGLTSAQDIRNHDEDALNIRWYAWWVKHRITGRGDVNHPSCVSILAGANAVLNAPLTTTTAATAVNP